jgi:hypothetical protein
MNNVDSQSMLHFRAVRLDACAFAAVLIAIAAAFYLNWDFWDDQAAQAYMTWGMFHGMAPYVDLVDPNWPGILIPHTVAYLIAGTDAWGLRALDLVFIYAMLMATSVVLAAWQTPPAMRLLAGCAYLTSYFATGWMWTAQRESFSWPLFVIGAIPFLLMLGPRAFPQSGRRLVFGAGGWFCFGIVSGLSLWTKPTSLLPVIVLDGTLALLRDRQDRAAAIDGIVCHAMGIVAVSIGFILTLAATGALPGFIKWGIYYDLGPYAQVKFSWPVRLHMMGEFFAELRFRQIAFMLAAVGCIVAINWPRERRRWNHPARPIIALLALVLAGVLSVFLQGKPGSLYHFIPLEWAMATFAAAVWSIIPWTKLMRNVALAMGLLIVVFTVYTEPRNAGKTAGTIAGRQLNARLGPDDEIVEWGYSPSLLLRAQRKTPFMTFIGTAFLITTPPDSWATREVLDRLDAALQNPAVRFFLVEREPNYRIQKSTPKWPKDYLTADAALRKTLIGQYRELPSDTIVGFHLFEHTAPAAASSP